MEWVTQGLIEGETLHSLITPGQQREAPFWLHLTHQHWLTAVKQGLPERSLHFKLSAGSGVRK